MPTCAETVFVRSACRVNPKAGVKVARGRRAEARDVLHLERRAAARAEGQRQQRVRSRSACRRRLPLTLS